MKPSEPNLSARSRSSLNLSARQSDKSSVLTNKYTDSLREKQLQGCHLNDDSCMAIESSLISGKLPPKKWFNIGPLSDEHSGHQNHGLFKSPADNQSKESSAIPEMKLIAPTGVQLIKLTFKDRQPGSSKRVSAGSQDRQTATRDESSRVCDVKDRPFAPQNYITEEITGKKKGPTPYFSFLTCSESMLEKSVYQGNKPETGKKLSTDNPRQETKTTWNKQKPCLEIETSPIELRTVDVCIPTSSDRRLSKASEFKDHLGGGVSADAQTLMMKSYLKSSIEADRRSIGLADRKFGTNMVEAHLRNSVVELFNSALRKIDLKSILDSKKT